MFSRGVISTSHILNWGFSLRSLESNPTDGNFAPLAAAIWAAVKSDLVAHGDLN